MATSGADHISGDASIEIKIKTLDSQTYTLKVDKQVPVPALKEQIASVTGVLSEQQRLICRGKVLKDDQLLSAYHVEDGHTLHMVVRQPIPPSIEGLPNDSGSDPASSTSRTHHITPGVIIETFSLPSQGDGPPPEISRILSAVLGSMGIQGLGGGANGIDNREQRPERTTGGSGTLDSVHIQSDQTGSRIPSGFGNSAAFSLGSLQPPVIPDSLTTLTQYLTNMQREFATMVRDGGSNGQTQASDERNSRQGLPTPANLAEVVVSTREILTVQAAEALQQLVMQLENQVNVTNFSARLNTQASAMRMGALVHNLGSFLLELGRTIMTLRMGQTPTEAVVNAGPAVFISPTGPNPIMVQPLPFQVGSSLGAIPMGAMQIGSGMVNGLGAGYIPRRIDIQIRRGSQTATANPSREEHSNTQVPPGPRNDPTGSASSNPPNQGPLRTSDGSDLAGESGVRVVPLRTMVAAVPGSLSRLSSDASGNPVVIYYPVLGRFPNAASGQVGGEQQSSESGRDASSQTLNPRQQDSTTTSTRSISLNILSAGATQSNSEPNGQIPNTVMQFLQNLFPGGEIHMEEESTEGVATGSSLTDQGRTSSVVPEPTPEAEEPRASEEGVFLSNILRQIMPLLPGQVGYEPASSSQHAVAQDSLTQAEGSGSGASGQAENSNGGASRCPDDCESGSSSTKRQKIE